MARRMAVTKTEIYCGFVPADVWPFRKPLVIELEVEVDSWRVLKVDTNAGLPGLQRVLRRVFCGMQVAHVGCCGLGSFDDR